MQIININSLLFFLITATLVICFARLILIDLRVRKYVKHNYHEYWEEKIDFFLFGGRASIFQITNNLNDPKIEKYKQQFIKALKQLIIITLIITTIVVIYILSQQI